VDQREVLQLYERSGALLQGHFILSSGRHSDRYLQSALVLMDLARAERLAKALVAKAGDWARGAEFVCAPAIGGLVIGQEVARVLGKPFIFTERKDGAMQLRRGFTIPKGARVLVVEDVVTTGGSVRECIEVLQQKGAKVIGVVALVDRAPEAEGRFSVPFASLLALSVPSWPADACPLCADPDAPKAIKPGSRS